MENFVGFNPSLVKYPRPKTIAFLSKYAGGMVLQQPIPIVEEGREIYITINPAKIDKWRSGKFKVIMWEERNHHKLRKENIRYFNDYTYSYYLMNPDDHIQIRPSKGMFDFKNKLITDNLEHFMTIMIKDTVGTD